MRQYLDENVYKYDKQYSVVFPEADTVVPLLPTPHIDGYSLVHNQGSDKNSL